MNLFLIHDCDPKLLNFSDICTCCIVIQLGVVFRLACICYQITDALVVPNMCSWSARLHKAKNARRHSTETIETISASASTKLMLQFPKPWLQSDISHRKINPLQTVWFGYLSFAAMEPKSATEKASIVASIPQDTTLLIQWLQWSSHMMQRLPSTSNFATCGPMGLAC